MGDMLTSWEKQRFIVPILIILAMSGLSIFYIAQESRNVSNTVVVTVSDRQSTTIGKLFNTSSMEHVRSNQMPIDDDKTPATNDKNETQNDDVSSLLDALNVSNTKENSHSNDAEEDQVSEQSDAIEKSSNDELGEKGNDGRDDIPTNKTIITWEGVGGMQSIVSRYWKGNLFCETIDQLRSAAGDPNLPITAKLSFSCKELYEKSELGTGNFIALFYGIRLAAHTYGNVDLFITCDDAKDTKEDLILPWITGWFPARPLTLNSSIPITVQQACGSYATQPLAYMYSEIQHDLRKMAVGLMGVPSADHASALFAQKYLWSEQVASSSLGGHLTLSNPQQSDIPPFPASKYGIDDAVLHFRCGDLMDSKHPSFAFMKFSGYTRHISPAAKTIGILTQPFDTDTQSRKADSGQYKRDRCRTVVYSLVEYIKSRYPKAEVRIHNEAGETIALTFARMIMANQTIAGISSFGVIPAVSTFGTGYIRRPDYRKAPNMWLINPRIDELTSNIILFDEPKKIMVGEMKSLWQSKGERGVLEWFWNDTAR
jgi:hypothetical protein